MFSRQSVFIIGLFIFSALIGSFLGLKNNVVYQNNLLASISDSTDVGDNSLSSISVDPRTNPSKSASLVFVGDIMLSRFIQKQIDKNENDFTFPFKNSYEFLESADLTFGNLEGPISDEGKNQGSEYSFRADPRVIEGLTLSGFDVLSLANNHIWDWGKDALKDTLNILKENNITYVGVGENYNDANNEKVFRVKGKGESKEVKIAFLAFTNLYPKSLEASADSPGISSFNIENIKSQLSKIKANKSADIIVVSLHWGTEYETNASAWQKKIAHELIDTGADIIVGHHPHVSQEVEKYNNGIIFYSLGNFIFDQNFSEETMRGLVGEVKIKECKIDVVNIHKSQMNKSYQPSIEFSYSL